eukprot:COSAG01_NODE_3036_length_6689_cov_943.531715_2_plen_63_part_00
MTSHDEWIKAAGTRTRNISVVSQHRAQVLLVESHLPHIVEGSTALGPSPFNSRASLPTWLVC